MTRLDVSEQFLFQLKAVGLPEPECEYRFAPPRKYRFDFAWPERNVAVELEGGIFTRQAHGSVTGILRDIEKYNLATSLGWRVFRVTPDMVKDGTALKLIEVETV